MRFKCPRCARRHAFPAARMNAAGRVPCRCGVTLVLHPPRGGRPLSAPGLATADIVALGYTIDFERTTGTFEAARQALRGGLGLGDGGAGVPDPARAARPALLWPALGLAWHPRVALPGAAALMAAFSLRWAIPRTGLLAPVVARAAGAVAAAVAAAAATIWAAAAVHEAVANGAPLTLGAGWRALRRRPALLVAAGRDAGMRAAAAALTLALAAVLAALGGGAGGAAAAWRWSAPAQVALVVAALAITFTFAHRLLTYAALTPRAAGLYAVQVDLEARRLGGDRAAVPARGLAPALVASLALALLLAAGVGLVLAVADALAAPFGGLEPMARAVARDLVVAAAGGVLCGYVGVTGLVGGYALGTGAPREPVRAPEIITGTQSSMNAVANPEDEAEEQDHEAADGPSRARE